LRGGVLERRRKERVVLERRRKEGKSSVRGEEVC